MLSAILSSFFRSMRKPAGLFSLMALFCTAAVVLNGCGGGGSQSSPVPITVPTDPPDPADELPQSSLAEGDDWTTFGHDVFRTGFDPLPTGITPQNVSKLQLRWTFKSGTYFSASPIVKNGIVYVLDHDGALTALNAQTGSLIWQKQIGLWTEMTPAIYDGILFVGIHDFPSQITALDPATGNQLWQQTVPGSLNGSPVAVNGVLYLGVALGDPGYCHPGGIYAFDEHTGSPRSIWLTEPGAQADGGGVWGPLSFDGQHVVYGTGNTCNNTPGTANAIVAMNSNMSTAWKIQTAPAQMDDDVGGGVFVLNGIGYVIGKTGTLYAVDLTSGSVTWSKVLGAGDGLGGHGTPTYTGSTLIVSGGDLSFPSASHAPGAKLYGLSLRGTTKWTLQTNYPVAGDVVSIPNLAFAELDNSIAALDPGTGHALWSYTTTGDFHASPAITPSGLFVADMSGTVYAFGLPSASSASKTARATHSVQSAIYGITRFTPIVPPYCKL